MQLVDDHVGEIRRHEILIVPGKGGGAQDAKAVRKVLRLELAGIGIADALSKRIERRHAVMDRFHLGRRSLQQPSG